MSTSDEARGIKAHLEATTISYPDYMKRLAAGLYTGKPKPHWMQALEGLDRLIAPPPPPPPTGGVAIPAFKTVLQPNNHETSSDNYTFGWTATKRPTPNAGWAGQGVIEFSDYPDEYHVVQCVRFDSGYPGRSPLNLHNMPPWEEFDKPPYNGVSPISSDYHRGVPNDATGGVVEGWMFVSEAELIAHRRGHWQLLTTNEITSDVTWTAHWTIKWGNAQNGYVKIRLFKGSTLYRTADTGAINTCYPNQKHVYGWCGGYESTGQVSPNTSVTYTLDYRGKTLPEALSDKPVTGDIWHSTSKGGGPDSSVSVSGTLFRPDAALLA